jgi:hypothetical protein
MAMALRMQRRKPKTKASTLLELLQGSRAGEATDSRDKVYAIVGLSWDFNSGSELIPDYDLSVREVYTSVVKAHIKKHENLDILDHCGYQLNNVGIASFGLLNVKRYRDNL